MSNANHNPVGRTRRRLSGAAVAILASAILAAPAGAQQEEGDESVGVSRAERVRPFTAFSNSALAMRDSLVQMARAQVGKRYIRGGASPDRGFDCSGLVRYVMSAFSFDLPRTAVRQASTGQSVGKDTAQLQPGDLLTFAKGKDRVSHIGIYVGNGRYIHASSVAGRVIESKIDRPPSPLIRGWRDTRRLIVAESDTSDTQR